MSNLTNLEKWLPQEKSWRKALQAFFTSQTFNDLSEFLSLAYEEREVYPSKENLYRAFELTPLTQVKVVIVGQDPYHGPGQANGLAFSVNPDVKLPPSLSNIFKELTDDLGIASPENGDLSVWAKQGILLLNRVLTVEKGQAASHRGKGWEELTELTVKVISQLDQPVVFILWGKQAQSLEKLITKRHHFVVKSPHPSPLSAYRGFFGSRPFSQVNQLLQKTGQEPIEW